ncbi:hypothetical protein HRbin08_00249 [bacterium HR08]|nr:hypothetical protein HRbin08_00249 [bacterium HR08]
MAGGAFQAVTAVMLVLTLMCLGANALGWIRLRALARLASGAQAALSAREIAGLGQLTGLIRLEAAYFTMLLLYALLYRGVLVLWPVVFVVLYHWLGWMANELTRTTSRAAAHVRREPAPGPSFRGRARLALAVIGVLDAIEAVILVYVIVALAHALHRSGA